jgi:hypothetical protein
VTPRRSALVALLVATLAPTAHAGGKAHAPPTPHAGPARLASRMPAPAPARPQLPRGGRTLFPRYRLVGFCGTPGAPALGKLRGDLAARAKEIEKLGEQYGGDREVLPTFELIAVVVTGEPGRDGAWRRRVPSTVIDDYLMAARAAKGILLLNIQPGHSDFMTEVKALEPYLREPDVSIAMDPEWAMPGPRWHPGVHWGHTTGEVVSEVAAYLSGIVKRYDLPEKPLVFHQVNDRVFSHDDKLVPAPGVVLIKSVDGLGVRGAKIHTYDALVKALLPQVHVGFKLFFDEDTKDGSKLMTPKEVLGLTPVPEYVMYE